MIAIICRIVLLDALFFRRSYDFYGCIWVDLNYFSFQSYFEMEKKRKTIYSRHISFHLRRTWRLFRSASENSRLYHSLDALRRSRECNRNKKYKTRLLSEARVSTRRGSLVGQEFTFVEEARKREFDREGGERTLAPVSKQGGIPLWLFDKKT